MLQKISDSLLISLTSTHRCQTIEGARAEAERIRKIGSAEAHAIELVGKAEAERMRMKANVYKQYGDAAIMNIVLESLPKVRDQEIKKEKERERET